MTRVKGKALLYSCFHKGLRRDSPDSVSAKFFNIPLRMEAVLADGLGGSAFRAAALCERVALALGRGSFVLRFPYEAVCRCFSADGFLQL